MNRGARWRWLPSLAVLVGALLALGIEPMALERAELVLLDAIQRRNLRPYTPAPVRIVDIDDASLQRMGQWPWPRTRIAQLVDRLTAMGAAVIAFDVVFAEPDRTSPDQVAALWPETADLGDLRERVAALPDHDHVLADSFRASRVVTGFVLMDHAGGRDPLARAGISWASGQGQDEPWRYLPDLLGSVVNLPVLEEAASGNGSFSIPWPEQDGIYRRAPLLFRRDRTIFPSLALEALRVATAGTTYLVRTASASGSFELGEGAGLEKIRVSKALTVPTDAKGRVWIHFTPHVPERYVPAWQVLEGRANRAQIEGHLIFVGTSAEGLKDLRATPVSPAMPGVEIHAQLSEQVLLGHYLMRPAWIKRAEGIAIVVLGLLLMALLPRLGAAWCALVGGGAVLGLFGFAWWAFTERGWLVAPVYAAVAVVGIYLTGSLAAFLRTEGERRQVRTQFGRYVAPELVSRLAREPDQLRLGGETREMTLLFCDVRDFTTLSESLEPEELTRLVNRFLTPMTSIILERRGTIDKYMGDCIMAFWNAPLDDPDHARHGCESALAMVAELGALNERLAADAASDGRPHVALRIGIGLNTGSCCVGNLGSDQRFDYSVIGDSVNLASRLEGQSKTYGVDVVIGEETREAVPGLATLELDRIRVKGKLQPVCIYGLLGDAARAAEPGFTELRTAQERMLAAYRAGDWDGADAALLRCREVGPSLEGLWDLYATRIADYRIDPPPDDWEGVYVARTK